MADDASTLQQQVWDFVYAYDAAYDRAAQAVGLSAAQACLLGELTQGTRAMGDLAVELLCDPSNVTQLVARLEARGLVTRLPDPADRRVKRVSITPAGRREHRAVRRAFGFPDDRLGHLTGEEQRQLSVLLAKVLAPGPGAAAESASTAPDGERPA
ncbi:MarR family winged helix-turn-helix transcriptional regulator [Modestobacter sp. VKM Ac-2985]|uniref:MarR family winged helix-turn-helix transcriptional regulator n=1 Tax=Modestobacter sp. VKM Ac-2985 TaxID=3004139 RepID=UPI0022AB5E2A|nr:MarR family transcriptional regulator [Modestobacter sp. VKM Ac-2985]MCZ2839208.1 MarR family transcriptional regulator [Modestobacter sp. VKM Ac-2985]